MEELRENLNALTENFKLTDPETVQVSQELDVEIVKYMKEQMKICA